MRTVELSPGIRSSVLGFGCAPILGSVDGKTADRALATALDLGVNYFDVAPSYGYGEAESWLGKRLAVRRSSVVIATKFGIIATPQARLLRPFKPLVRLLKPRRKVADGSTKVSAAPIIISSRFHKRVPITAAGMRKSIESSLRALRTDHLDYIFIHEPHLPLNSLESLAIEVQSLKERGMIRAWGLAFMRSQRDLHRNYMDAFDIWQFNLSLGCDDYSNLSTERSMEPNVIFSPFSGLPNSMRSPMAISGIINQFTRSVVLCSMFNPLHIRQNVDLCA